MKSNSCENQRRISTCTLPHINLIMLLSDINNIYMSYFRNVLFSVSSSYCIAYFIIPFWVCCCSSTCSQSPADAYSCQSFANSEFALSFWVHEGLWWVCYLINSLFALFVFLSFLLDLLPLLNLINQLEKVAQVEDHRLSLRTHTERWAQA